MTTYSDIEVINGRDWYYNSNSVVDMISGAYNQPLGHCNPLMVEIITDAANKVCNCYRLKSKSYDKLSELLNYYLPIERYWYYQTTGAEAVEKALMCVLPRSGVIVVMKNCFHGKLLGISNATFPNIPHWRSPFRFHFIDWMDFESLPAEFDAILWEPIQGATGYRTTDSELKELRTICDNNNAWLIADEVFCGIWRGGKFAYSVDANPDILILGKGLAGHVPLSAIGLKTQTEISVDWYTTNAGNDFACNVALNHIPQVEHAYANSRHPVFTLIPKPNPRDAHSKLLDKGIVTGYSNFGIRLAPCFTMPEDAYYEIAGLS